MIKRCVSETYQIEVIMRKFNFGLFQVIVLKHFQSNYKIGKESLKLLLIKKCRSEKSSRWK